jgi:hypothetical protein
MSISISISDTTNHSHRTSPHGGFGQRKTQEKDSQIIAHHSPQITRKDSQITTHPLQEKH